MPASPPSRTLTAGQRAYEAKRAAKAGMSLEKWLAEKDRAVALEGREKAKAARVAAKEAKKSTGFFSRMLARAHKPLTRG